MVLRHSRWLAACRGLITALCPAVGQDNAELRPRPPAKLHRWTLLRNVDCQKYFAKKLPENGGIAQPRAM